MTLYKCPECGRERESDLFIVNCLCCLELMKPIHNKKENEDKILNKKK